MANDPTTAAREEGPPARVYELRLLTLRERRSSQQARARHLGLCKLAVAISAVVVGLSLMHHSWALGIVVGLALSFPVLAVLHERVLRSLRACERSIEFYQRGTARLNDLWPGNGDTGERFFDPLHPYARDLDIFGKASLFEFLCAARTRSGEETLAKWLLAPAPIAEVRSRQSAVIELKDRVDFREKLHGLGETVRLGVHPESLSAWGEGPLLAGSASIAPIAVALAILWIASLVCWAVWGIQGFALFTTLVNLGYAHHIHGRLDEAAGALEHAAKDLALLAEVLAFFEQQSFTSPRLHDAQEALKEPGTPPSAAIRKLRRIAEAIESRHNPFGRVLDIFIFWSAHLLLASERWKRRFGPAIRSWLAAVGELEALASLSGFAYENPESVFPTLVAGGPLFDAGEFAHPLLPAAVAVPNTLKLGALTAGNGIDLIILSGPNMAGKSTFIRSIGVNVVLAQCGAPVRAARLTLSPLAVGASICVLDSLSGGTSRFYAEINRIKLISDLTQGTVPVLFLLDELLSGTNSHDRLAGTQYVVRDLLKKGAIGIVSTHDLALTQIPATFQTQAINCHFEDGIEDGKLTFDYKLKPGVVQSSNALELMRSIGLGVGP